MVASDEEKRRTEERQSYQEAVEERQARIIHEKKQKRAEQLETLRERYGTGERELEIWPKIQSALRLSMTEATYKAWLKSSQLLRLQGNKAIIGVANQAAKEWVEARLIKVVKQVMNSILDVLTIQVTIVNLEEAKNNPPP